jgi:transcriptional regulator with PAS, ATPase and Fis domain
MDKLMSHTWPGNVRELENVIERALALRGNNDRLTAEDIVIHTPSAPKLGELPAEGIVMEDLEKELLKSALARAGNNQTRAAKLLGITRQQLIYRMQKYDLH